MARLIMWNLVSLDGFFEGPGSDLSFHQYAWGPELESFIQGQVQTIGTIVFGRKTYEGMAAYWHDKTDPIGRVMNETPKVVFSRTRSSVDWQNSRLATAGLRETILELKRASVRDAFLLGSGSLCSALARENLIDEYRVGVVSVLLGKGTHLFADLAAQVPLRLVEARPLGDRLVLHRYVPAPA